MRHLPGTLLAADGLTKVLAKTQFEKCRIGMGLDVLEEKKVKMLGSKPNATFGAAGWLVVDKLKEVIGMLSLAANTMAEEVVEIDEEASEQNVGFKVRPSGCAIGAFLPAATTDQAMTSLVELPRRPVGQK